MTSKNPTISSRGLPGGSCNASFSDVGCNVLFHRNLDKIGEENVAVPLSW